MKKQEIKKDNDISVINIDVSFIPSVAERLSSLCRQFCWRGLQSGGHNFYRQQDRLGGCPRPSRGQGHNGL